MDLPQPVTKDNKSNQFFAGMFDTVGSTELKDAGKAGLVTIQGKISVVLGTVLICKFFDTYPSKAVFGI